MIDFEKHDWLKELSANERAHALNNPKAILQLFKSVRIERGDKARASRIINAALAKDSIVLMFKGIHQEKFGSKNKVDQSRIDQSHFNVLYQGIQYHVYVQPNLAQRFEITEINTLRDDLSDYELPESVRSVLIGSGAFD